MKNLGRRAFLASATAVPVWLVAPRAHATLMRGLPLRSLCARSRHIVLVRAFASRSISLAIAGRPMIVSETQVRVEESLSRSSPENDEIVVRTLGGVLDGIGELVHGQAEFARDARCLVFLTRAADGSSWVTGMAQGHYPLVSSGSEPRLSASPRLPALRDFDHSAVRGLVGSSLTRARQLIAEELRGD